MAELHLSQFVGYDISLRKHGGRNITIGIFLSLLLHGLLLFVSAPNHIDVDGTPQQKSNGPLAVRLLHATPESPALPPKSPPAHIHKPAPTRRHGSPIAVLKPSQKFSTQKQPPVQSAPQPSAPQMDFMGMINAKRRAAEDGAARENADAQMSSQERTADEISTANINRNLQTMSRERDGTNGVFQILRKGTRTAQFSFRGWTKDARNNWHETIDVDAGLHGDVDLAIVQKMIERIRKDYQGNFNWESRRLGRVIVLSARMEDNADLENFLMREFFGMN
ncbi:MAG: hypothetical protein V4568_11680 [Pseudomonadota bacterium]